LLLVFRKSDTGGSEVVSSIVVEIGFHGNTTSGGKAATVVGHKSVSGIITSSPLITNAPMANRRLQFSGNDNVIYGQVSCPACYNLLTSLYSFGLMALYCIQEHTSIVRESLPLCIACAGVLNVKLTDIKSW
jgi:hypothetical protein